MSGPLVSVVIPAYNRREMLRSCIDSVRRQTYQNWECIVVDDHSTDGTFELATRLSIAENRIKAFSNTGTKGAQGARNTGIRHASGSYVAFLDSDNTFMPDKLQACVAAIEARPDIDVVSSFSTVVNGRGERIRAFNWVAGGHCHHDILRLNAYVDFSQTFVRKEKLLAIGLLDERCPSYQEWETHIRLSRLPAKYHTIERELNVYLDDASDRISTNPWRDILGWHYVLDKHALSWDDARLRVAFGRLILRGVRRCLRRPTWEEKAFALRFIALWAPMRARSTSG